MTTDDYLLQQGVEALKAGRKTEARNLLTQVVERDRHNEMAWLWLSGAVETDDDRRVCLENVLAINPHNSMARRGLESLLTSRGVQSLRKVSAPPPPTEPPATPPKQSPQPPTDVSIPDATQRKKRKAVPKGKKVTKPQTSLIVGIVAAVSVVACVGLVGIWWAINSGLLQLGPAASGAIDSTVAPPAPIVVATPTSGPTSIPTWTPTPTKTPGATNTPRPTRTPRPTNTPRPTLPPQQGTFNNPVPIGTSYRFPGFGMMTVEETRWQSGQTGLAIVRISFDCERPSDQTCDTGTFMLDAVGNSGSGYNREFESAIPEPSFGSLFNPDIYGGATEKG